MFELNIKLTVEMTKACHPDRKNTGQSALNKDQGLRFLHFVPKNRDYGRNDKSVSPRP